MVINMKFDMGDIGNLVLGIGMALGVYLTTKGLVAEAVLVIAIVGTIKAFASAVDNYNFKKSQSETVPPPS